LATTTATSSFDLRAVLVERWWPLGVAACSAGLAAFFLASLTRWPPHEDETLALFVGRDSLGGLLHTVQAERGGAPLHFLIAWVVVHLGGGLTALRLASAVFAVASVPVLAALSARLAGRQVALVAAALACASWLMLFHGVFGRMYSLFLLTSALSYLALLVAVERGGRGRWALWALATLAAIASHPYGVLVLASQGVFVLARARTKQAIWALAIVTLTATPFWLTDRVLAGRLDAGVGQGHRLPVLGYLADAAGDASSGFLPVFVPVLALAVFGCWRLRPSAALLTACVVVVPAVLLGLAHFGSAASPESRHLVFVLPFFSTALASGLVALLRRRVALVGALVVLLAAEVGWAWHRTPALFEGESTARIEARQEASAWLAATARRDDVLFGYDPLFLGAWERDRGDFPATVVPRADAKLALSELRSARTLGRGVWVLDAGDNNNRPPRSTIALRLPSSAFEGRVFGPYLVLRTRAPTQTPAHYLTFAASAMRLGQQLGIVDDDGNLHTILIAEERLG